MAKSLFGQKVVNLSKRLRISRAQRMTLLEVAVASLIIGASIVLIIFLAKYIKLNGKAIRTKGESIENYSRTIANVGICVDSNKDGKVDVGELSKCSPNDITLDQIPDTLQSNVMTKTATNKALESVAKRNNLSASCFDSNGKLRNFLKEYQESKGDASQKKQIIEEIKTCSALRVIPDALPAQQNVEAASASLDWLLKQAGVRYESMTPSDDDSSDSSTTASSVDSIPLSLILATNARDVYHAALTIERSIRTFDVDSMVVEWGGGSNSEKLNFTFKLRTYYSGQLTVNEKKVKVTTKGAQ